MTGKRGGVPTTEELLAAWRAAAGTTPAGTTPAGTAPTGTAPAGTTPTGTTPAEAADTGPVDERVRPGTPPWDLAALVREAAAGTTTVLVIDGTDSAGLEADLARLGVATVRHDGGPVAPLPFPERCVDVVVARHRDYDPAEVARVLRPGGVLLVEQAGGDDLVDLHAVLGATLPHPRRTLGAATQALLDAGLRVTHEESWRGPVEIDDVDALVAWLVTAPERAPADFSVDGYANTLLYLHMRGPAWGQPLAFTLSRYLVRAERPS